MDEREKTLLVSKAKELGWQVTVDENGWEFQKSTPVGETFRVSVTGEDVVGELRKIYCGVTAENHVTIHMDAGKLGIHDVTSLTKFIDSASAFRETVDTLYHALSDVEDAYLEEEADSTNCELGIYDCSTCNINGNCTRQDEEGGALRC